MSSCQSCVLSLPPNHYLESHEYFVSPVLHSLSENTSEKHVTNLAYLYQFFDADIVRVIPAHDYYPDPVKIVTPNFFIYEHKLSERVATSEQFRVDLTRVAQSVKNDGIILNSLIHAM